jgi:peptidoglycan/LPS O-acetylase OafA/YrhL
LSSRRLPRFRAALLALSSPLLILLALLVMLQRQGADRLPAVPALVIGAGLLATSWLQRRRRRAELLRVLREERPAPVPTAAPVPPGAPPAAPPGPHARG